MPPFNVIRRRKSCMLLCGGTAKILKEFASLLFTWSLIRKVCFERVWMFWISECVCLIIFFKMIGLWSQVNNLYLISWSPTLMNSHTSSEGTEAPIIYFVHLSSVLFLCFWLEFLFVFFAYFFHFVWILVVCLWEWQNWFIDLLFIKGITYLKR